METKVSENRNKLVVNRICSMLCCSWNPVGGPVVGPRGGLFPRLPGVRAAHCLQNVPAASARALQHFWCVTLKRESSPTIRIFSNWCWKDTIINTFVGVFNFFFLILCRVGMWFANYSCQRISESWLIRCHWFVCPEHGHAPDPEVQLLKVACNVS